MGDTFGKVERHTLEKIEMAKGMARGFLLFEMGGKQLESLRMVNWTGMEDVIMWMEAYIVKAYLKTASS